MQAVAQHGTGDTPPPVRRRILAIDGGGIRCLIAIEVLSRLEADLAQRSGDPGFRLCQHFDLAAGTSGGAIIATAVALGIPMEEIRDFVVRNARNMFRPAEWRRRLWHWYDKSELERNMKEWFGADTTLGSARLRTLLLVVLRNLSTDSPWLVSNHAGARFNNRDLDDCNLDLHLWQLARASAAAPVYYAPETIQFGRRKPYRFLFVDGGLTGFLNPAFKAFLFATTSPYGLSWPVGEDRLTLLSLGSGDVRRPSPGLNEDDVTLWRSIQSVTPAMLYATQREQDLLCRTFGNCLLGDPIDAEIEDLAGRIQTAASIRLFRYFRVNAALSPEGLERLGCPHIDARAVQRLDAVQHVEAISEIGRALAGCTVPAYLAAEEQPARRAVRNEKEGA